MRRTNSSIATELGRSIAAAAEATSWGDLRANALPPLERALDASAALLYRYDDEGLLVPLGGSLGEHMGDYARGYLYRDPAHGPARRMPPALRVVLVERHLDPRQYRRSAAYGEFYAKHDLEHLACAWLTALPYGAPGMTGLLLTRPRAAAAFSDDEARLLRRALPALGAAARRAGRQQALDQRQAAVEAVAAARGAELVLSVEGAVLWASPAAERLLGGLLARCGSLPDAVTGAARRLADAIRDGGLFPPPALSARFRVGDEEHEAHLSVLRGPAAAPMIRVEIEGREPARNAARTLEARFGLTRAEALVLAQLAFGRSNAEIAERLDVGIETVRTHLQRILQKLNVASRVEAALRARRAM